MRSIKINRNNWLNGSNANGNSCLWDDELKKGCCLGHAIHQTTRCSWNDLISHEAPIGFFSKKDILGLTEINPNSLFGGLRNTKFSQEAMRINDHEGYSEKEREGKLISLFRANNIKLSFHD